MNDWVLKYNMDDMQWVVTEIHLYEPSMPDVYFDGAYELQSYINCIKLIWLELLTRCKDDIKINLHCPEYTYLLNKNDIKWIMKQHFPEELI